MPQYNPHPNPTNPTQPQATPQLEVSDVVNSDTGEFEASTVRTSTGTFLHAHQDDVVVRIEKRVAQVTMTPQGRVGGAVVVLGLGLGGEGLGCGGDKST